MGVVSCELIDIEGRLQYPVFVHELLNHHQSESEVSELSKSPVDIRILCLCRRVVQRAIPEFERELRLQPPQRIRQMRETVSGGIDLLDPGEIGD
ncbi:hypothetical protein D3C87_1729270 [compost metagenome]